MSRPTWKTYFLTIAGEVAKRATCPRAAVGCVLVFDKRILATGYNGAPPLMPHCEEVGCRMEDGHCTRTVHAEANAIAQAARYGISVAGSTAYVTHTPCLRCQQLLQSAGVEDWYCGVNYP